MDIELLVEFISLFYYVGYSFFGTLELIFILFLFVVQSVTRVFIGYSDVIFAYFPAFINKILLFLFIGSCKNGFHKFILDSGLLVPCIDKALSACIFRGWFFGLQGKYYFF